MFALLPHWRRFLLSCVHICVYDPALKRIPLTLHVAPSLIALIHLFPRTLTFATVFHSLITRKSSRTPCSDSVQRLPLLFHRGHHRQRPRRNGRWSCRQSSSSIRIDSTSNVLLGLWIYLERLGRIRYVNFFLEKKTRKRKRKEMERVNVFDLVRLKIVDHFLASSHLQGLSDFLCGNLV